MTKRFCDACGQEIKGCQWWTLGKYEDLCGLCYRHMKALVALVVCTK